MTTYNRDPYFDDFDKSKNFVKILFKPGVAVQARELTQLQTAIQEQIKSIGGFLFKNESLVTGGNSRTFYAVWIDVVSTDLSDYVSKTFVGQTSGAKIQVISYKNNISAGVSRLYFVYKNGLVLTNPEEIVEDVLSPSVSTVTTTNSVDNTGMAMAYKISESVFYVKEYFVVCPEQTIIISDNAAPSVKIGLTVTEDIITYQDDATLLDPATGSYNYAAPGADRVSISLDLTTHPFDPTADLDAELMVENTEDNFIELARYNNGVVVSSLTSPTLGSLEGVLARRTYDESGDYTVRAFKTKATNSVKKDPEKLSLAIEPGKAYVKGYEFETTSTLFLDLEKARETNIVNNFYGDASFGDYFIINNPTGGTLSFTTNPEINLVNGSAATIGTARVRTVTKHSSTQLKLYVYDVSFTTGSSKDVTVVSNSPWTATVDSTNANKIYFGKNSPRLIPFTKSPIKSATDISYTSQTRVISTATATELSAPTTLESGKTYFSSNPDDYIVVSNTTPFATVTGFTVTVSGGQTFTLSGTFSAGNAYSVYAKIAVSIPTVKTKVKTSATYSITNSNNSSISLGISDVYRIVSIYAAKNDGTETGSITQLEVTGRYSLDNGQKDDYYDYSRLVLRQNQQAPNTAIYDRLLVNLEYFATPQTNGYYSIDSYDTAATTENLLVPYENIPVYTSANGNVFPLRDVIDFRAKRNAVSIPTTALLSNPISTIATTAASGSGTVATLTFATQTVAPFKVGSKITIEGVTPLAYNAKDVTVISCTTTQVTYSSTATGAQTVAGKLSTPEHPAAKTITGDEVIYPVSSITADFEYYLPRIDKLIITKEKKFDLIKGISSEIPQIPADSSDAMTIYTVEVPAYTFSAEEVRMNYVENRRYTMRDIGNIDKRVDRLEYYTSMSLLEKQASDEVIVNFDGVDKFKNGILVDPFAGHGVGDVGAREYSCSIDAAGRILRPKFSSDSLTFDVNLSETNSADYSKKDDLITLPYSTEVYISNNQATNWKNLNPYAVFSWNGEIKLNPATDTWTDTTSRPDVIVNINGENDAFTKLVDDVTNPASSGVQWNSWQTAGRGVTVTPSTTNSSTSSTALRGSQAIQSTSTTTTTTTTTTVNESSIRSGIETERSAVSTITRDLGNKVVDTSIVPFIRSRVVDFSATKLKPSTELFASFDGIDVTRYCTQAPVIYVETKSNATRVRKIGTSKAANIVLLKTDRAYVKMDIDQAMFSVGDIVEFLVDNAWVTGTTITDTNAPSSDVLITDENGDLAGYFLIPNNNDTKFRTGERPFRLADTLGKQPLTAAETKYVAQGLAMSLQKDIIATRVVSVAVNPIEQSRQTTSSSAATSTEVSVVQRNVTVQCGDTQTGAGRTGRFVYDLEFGTDIGLCGINYFTGPIPDCYTITWNGQTVTTGFRSLGNSTAYNAELSRLGRPAVTSVINANNPVQGSLRFNKTSIYPTRAQLTVDAPLSGTAWNWRSVCPGAIIAPAPAPAPAPSPSPAPAPAPSVVATTPPRLNVIVDAPASTATAFTSQGGAPAFPGVLVNGVLLSGLLGPRPAIPPTIATRDNGVNFNFTVRIVGNQGVPHGTPVRITSISRSESTTNGRFSSFAAGSRFRGGVIQTIFSASGLTFPITTTVGAILSFVVSYDFTSSAKTQGLNISGAVRDPVSTISVSAELVTPIGGSNLAASGSDSVVHNSTYQRIVPSCGNDPLAQTFFVSSEENPDGIFVDSVDLFFKTKDDSETVPLSVQIRPTVNGYPSSDQVLPFAIGDVLSKDVVISPQDSVVKAATRFNFQAPVFLSADTEYALVVLANSDKFEVYTSSIGETLLSNPSVRCTKQPLSGSLFASQNGTTWTAIQTDDLVMRINKCVFNVDVEKPVILNANIPIEMATNEYIDYDVLFMDGEVLDFANTNVNYSYKTAKLSGAAYAKDPSWNSYQLGSNIVLPERRTLNIQDPTTLRVKCALKTANKDVSPVIDLNRLSSVLVKNLVNNNSNSETSKTFATVTSVSATDSDVTITTSAAHGFTVGDTVFVYTNDSNEVNGLVTILTVPTTSSFTYTRFDGGDIIAETAQGGTIIRNAQAISRYITRKVTLNSEFYSTDLKAYFLANIPAECAVIPYYRVTSLSDPVLEDNDWIPMTLDTVGTTNSAGFAEYKYKTPYTLTSNSVALATGETFGTFSVKLVMLSSNTVKVPLIKDLRVLALDD